jgi:hypothetical protein
MAAFGSKYGRPTDRRLETRILIQGAFVSAIERFQELEYGKKIEALRLKNRSLSWDTGGPGQHSFMNY